VIDSGSGSGKTAAPSNGNAWQIERSDNLNYHTPKNNDSEPCRPLIFPLEFEAPLLYDENTPGVNPTRKIGGHIQISINQDLKVTMQVRQPDNGSRTCLNGSFTTTAKFSYDRKLLSFSTSGTGVKSYISGSGRRDKQVKIWVRGDCNLRSSRVMVSGWSGRISYNDPTRTQSINQKTHAVWRHPCRHGVQGKIEVKIRFDDEDDLLTPSDEAHLKISVTNSTRQKLDSFTLYGTTSSAIKGKGVIAFYKEDVSYQVHESFERLHMIALNPGKTATFNIAIRVAGERNRWIFENLIEGSGAAVKPQPELCLQKIVHLKLTAQLNNQNQIMLDEDVVIKNGAGEIVPLAYPDFSMLAGQPKGRSASELNYYRNGDLHWCSPGDRLIRAVALRAARFGGMDAGTMEEASSPDPKQQLFTPKSPKNWQGPLLPEGKKQVEKVVKNIINFVFYELNEKNCPRVAFSPAGLAMRIWQGWRGPAVEFVICQELSYIVGSLCRALGISMREVNFLSSFIIGFSQDAACQIYYDGDWHFFGLFDDEKPFTDYLAHYSKSYKCFNVFEMWVGRGCWHGTETRFRLEKDKNSAGPATPAVWEYYGFSNGVDFIRTKSRPSFGSIIDSRCLNWIYYKVYCPVRTLLKVADGKKLGAQGPIDLQAFQKFFFLGKSPPANLVREISGSMYLPAGLTFYLDANDPASGETTPECLALPVPDETAKETHQLFLTGTGDGEFTITCHYYDGHQGEVREIGRLTGEIKKGEVVQIPGYALVPGPLASIYGFSSVQ
jgi:hypothetical protein